MARHEHLPIYKQSYELLNQVVIATKDFPREFKFTIGQRLRDEVIELLIRLCQDLRILPKKNYAALALIAESLARQAEGWKKSINKLS